MGENREEPEDKARWVVLDMASLIEPNVRFDAPQASDLRPCSDSTGHDHVVGPVSLVYDVTNEKGWDGTPATKIVIENKTMTVIGERRDERVLDRETYDFFVIAVPK